jgi:acyl-CoA synthetase (NDP forming)
MYDALFKQIGVIRAQTFADLLDIPGALASVRKARGRRVAILTSTGGAGTLVADSLGMATFETPAPDAATAAQLRTLQTGGESALDRNPIDVTLAGLQPDLLRSAIRILLASPGYDALVVIVGSSGLAMPELMADAIRDSLATTDKPVLAYVSPYAPGAISTLNQRGVPTFDAPESCATALLAMLQSALWKDASAPETSAEILVPAGALRSGSLNEAEAKLLFARFGIPSVGESVVNTPEEAVSAASRFGGKVALKLLSDTITHKSDVGGVAINVDAADAGERLLALAANVSAITGHAPDAFVVQEMLAGTEMILGFHRDPLGTAILLGMGGVAAELFNDTTLRLLTDGRGLSRDEALSMIRELRTWPLLDGYRGRARCDVDALASAIVAFSQMTLQLGERLLEAEINPLFVLPAGQGVRAADGVLVLA